VTGHPEALQPVRGAARNGLPAPVPYTHDPDGHAAARTASQMLDDLRQVIAARMWAGAPLTPLPDSP
jgi:hypothetical protein